MKYTIELTDDEISVLVRALDDYQPDDDVEAVDSVTEKLQSLGI